MHWTNARDFYTRRNLHTELVAVRSIGIVKYLHLSVYYAQFEGRQFFFFYNDVASIGDGGTAMISAQRCSVGSERQRMQEKRDQRRRKIK